MIVVFAKNTALKPVNNLIIPLFELLLNILYSIHPKSPWISVVGANFIHNVL